MSEHDNLSVVKEIYSAQRNHNILALRNHLANDVKWFSIGPPEIIPTAGTRIGPDRVEKYFAAIDVMAGSKSFAPQEFIVEGNKVVAIGNLQHYVPATGSFITSPWIHVFTFENGKVTEFRSFYDTAAAIAALENPMTENQEGFSYSQSHAFI